LSVFPENFMQCLCKLNQHFTSKAFSPLLRKINQKAETQLTDNKLRATAILRCLLLHSPHQISHPPDQEAFIEGKDCFPEKKKKIQN